MAGRLSEFWLLHGKDLKALAFVLFVLIPALALPFVLLPIGDLTSQSLHSGKLVSFEPTQVPKVMTGTRRATAMLENGRLVRIHLPISGAYKRDDEIKIVERKHRYGPYRYYAITDQSH